MQRFLFTNCTLFHDELFVIATLGGLPAKINPCDGEIKYYDGIEGFIVRPNGVVIDFMESFQDKIYVLESDGKNLIVFDLKKNQCQYIELNCNYLERMNFAAFERYHSDYYIFPKYGNKILIFNTKKNKITEIVGYLDNINEIQCVCREENNVWILPKNTDIIYCYDLINGIKEKYKLKKKISNCVHAVFQDGCIYILNKFGSIYIWNIRKGKLDEITDLETEHNENLSMSRIIYAGGKCILLPAKENNIKILDLSTKKIGLYQNYPKDFYNEIGQFKFYGYCENEKYYYFAMCANNYLLKIEKHTGELVWIKPKLGEETAIRSYFEKTDAIFIESRFCEFTDMIKFLPERKKSLDGIVCVGGKIYTAI